MELMNFRESTFAVVVQFLTESKSIYGEENIKLAKEAALMKTRIELERKPKDLRKSLW